MRKLIFTIVALMLVSPVANAAVKWNNGNSAKKGSILEGKDKVGNYEYGLKTTKESGFQKHSTGHSGINAYNFSYIENKDEARAGIAFQRFELRDGDCFKKKSSSWSDCKTDRERIEFSAWPEQKPQGKHCYGYSLKLDKNYEDITPAKTDLGQIHQIDGPRGRAGGFISNPPLIQMHVKNNVFYLGWHKLSGKADNVEDEMLLYKLKNIFEMKGEWTDVSICIDVNEKIEAWVDGVKKVEINEKPINFFPKTIYFRHGIYRGDISKYKVFNKDNKLPTQIVFFDEVRRGKMVEDVDRNINPKLKPVD